MSQFEEFGQEIAFEYVEGSIPLGVSCATVRAYAINQLSSLVA